MSLQYEANGQTIVLVGGGHAHVAVLADWADNGLPAKNAILLTPHRFLRYSGMVPGWIAGEHQWDEGRVDLAGLAQAAGAELVLDRCVAIDPEARSILTTAQGLMPFTIASIDTGGIGRAAKVLGDDARMIDVRPIDGFVGEVSTRLAELQEHRSHEPQRIAIIGGGAAGFEIAFGLRNANGLGAAPEITLFAGRDGPLPSFSDRAKRLIMSEFAAQGMRAIDGDASLSSGRITVSGRSYEPQDIIIAAIGSGAPDWPRAGGLAVDEDGFIAVDAHQRSTSHQHIFAAGDVAARLDCAVLHSGVHAVHTGPVLAANIRSALLGKAPRHTYRPRRANLYLLSTGRGEAIASYGRFAAQGHWAAWLKAWIDKRWIKRYAKISS